MEKKKWVLRLTVMAVVAAAAAGHYLLDPWGYYHKVSPQEADARQRLVSAAQSYLGCNEADGSYLAILNRYNAQEVLPQNYALQSTDSWCAAYVSVCAMDAGMADIIPLECGCQRQIGLWQALGRWEEDDNAVPLPGDLIYYDWDWKRPGDCTGWADHVGIVVGVKWPFVKVIEGNRDDRVCYRVIPLGALPIRGYGRPDFSSLSQ